MSGVVIPFPAQGQLRANPQCISVSEEPISWDEPEKLFNGQSKVAFI